MALPHGNRKTKLPRCPRKRTITSPQTLGSRMTMKQIRIPSLHSHISLLFSFSADKFEGREDAAGPQILADIGAANLRLATFAKSLHVRMLVNFDNIWTWHDGRVRSRKYPRCIRLYIVTCILATQPPAALPWFRLHLFNKARASAPGRCSGYNTWEAQQNGKCEAQQKCCIVMLRLCMSGIQTACPAFQQCGWRRATSMQPKPREMQCNSKGMDSTEERHCKISGPMCLWSRCVRIWAYGKCVTSMW